MRKRVGEEKAKVGREMEAVARCTPHANILVNIIKYNQLTHAHSLSYCIRRDRPFYAFL